MPEAYILSAVRTPVGKAPRGALRQTRPDDLAALVIRTAVERVPGLEPRAVDDVILGCAMPEGPAGSNMARIASLAAGLPDSVPAVTVNRFCASGAETIARAAAAVKAGLADVVVAGGAESMSMIPAGGGGFSPNPRLVDECPNIYLSMGLTAENVARRYGISREDADAYSFGSHQKAIAAIEGGRFADECVSVPIREVSFHNAQPTTHNSPLTTHRVPCRATGPSGEGEPLTVNGVSTRESVFSTDEGPRADTSLAALAKLRPVFHVKGTVTAGNSSQTSDGAAAVVVVSEERMKELGARPLGRFVAYAAAGVAPEVMGMGPVAAIPLALKRAGLQLSDMDLIELNEAFACQALAVIREAGLPEDRINVNGGAVALGHPLGATGAKLTCTLLNELRRRGGRYGMVTMCVGGGQGAALILESLN